MNNDFKQTFVNQKKSIFATRVNAPLAWVIIGATALVFAGGMGMSIRSPAETEVSTVRIIRPFVTIPLYSELEWNGWSPYSVSVLLNENTSEETTVISEGEKTIAATSTVSPNSIYEFYHGYLIGESFSQLRKLGDPTAEDFWITDYVKDDQLVEIQYYPDAQQPGVYTILLYSGTYPRGN